MARKTFKIFIDNTGHPDEKEFGYSLVRRLLSLKVNVDLQVITFMDLDNELGEDNDPNNENGTLNAIEKSDIVIPVISSIYISSLTPRIEKAIRDILISADRYLFPIIFGETDWSNLDWVVRSALTPRDSKPLLEKKPSDAEKIIDELIYSIKTIIQTSSNAPITAIIPRSEGIRATTNQVFVSHDHDDADFAELLKLRLEKEGINCWLDTERLKIGQDWREEIDRGIEASAAVIAIMTPQSKMSEYVTYEWAFAWGKGKRIFPIMLRQTQLHPRLESLQYLNFTNHPTRPWYELVSSLKKVIQELK